MSEISIPAPAAIAASSHPDSRGLIRRTQGLLVPAVLVIVWETVVRAGWVSPHLLPPPSELVTTLADLAGNGTLLGHIGISSLRVLIGFFIGAGLAVAVGAAVGLSRRTEALLDPTFPALRAIPSLAWVPLLLLWLGIDEAPKITLIAIGAFFPVYLNFVAGIHNVDRKLVEVGGIYGTTLLLVTHDVSEAVYLSDRVIVLADRPGRISSQVIVDTERPRDRRNPQLVKREAEVLTLLNDGTNDFFDLSYDLASAPVPWRALRLSSLNFAV